MTETRRNLFKTSVLSIFGAMTGTAIVSAAARAKSDADEGLGPILVRAKEGLYLLEPKENGDMRVYEITLERDAVLPPNLNPHTIAQQRGVTIKAFDGSRDLRIHDDKALEVKDGIVGRAAIKAMKMSDASWTEIEMKEFAWIEHWPSGNK